MIAILSVWVLLNVALIETSNVTNSTCPPKCVCLDLRSSVNCSDQGLESVPDNLPRNTALLDVSHNRIKCDCSLSWIINSTVKLIGECDSPPALHGRHISNVSYSEMCLNTSDVPPIEVVMASCGLRGRHSRRKRVVGGDEALRNSWPWMVSFVDEKHKQQCAGSIIDHEWVLTAAHCFVGHNYVWYGDYTYRVADHHFNSTDPGEYEVKPSHVFVHPTFTMELDPRPGDIALVKLATPLNYSALVRPVCLPSVQASELPVNSSCYVIGWGNTEDTSAYHRSPHLKELKLHLVSNKKCNDSYSEHHNLTIGPNSFCAGSQQGGVGGCFGDSGGPLQCEVDGVWTQVGIMLWGTSCAKPNAYGVYRDVGKDLTFIRAVLNGPNSSLTTYYQKQLSDVTQNKPSSMVKLYELLTQKRSFSDIDLVRNLQLLPKQIEFAKTSSLMDLEFFSNVKFRPSTKLINVVQDISKQWHRIIVYNTVMSFFAKLNVSFDEALELMNMSKTVLLDSPVETMKRLEKNFYVAFYLKKALAYNDMLLTYCLCDTSDIIFDVSQVQRELEQMSQYKLSKHMTMFGHLKLRLVKDNKKVFTSNMTLGNISGFIGTSLKNLMNMTVSDALSGILNISYAEFAALYRFNQVELELIKHRKISSISSSQDRSLFSVIKAMLPAEILTSPAPTEQKTPTSQSQQTLSSEKTVATNISSTLKPTGLPGLNLTELITASEEMQPNVQALAKLVETLENNVHNWSRGGEQKSTAVLRVASNLLMTHNRAVWERSSKNSSGVQKLLRIVNEALTLQAKELLMDDVKRTRSLVLELNNIDVYILVGSGQDMSEQKLEFPRAKKQLEDSIEFPRSVFKREGQRKLAIIVASFDQMAEFLPQLSLVSNFGSFQVNSRVLSANVISLNGSIATPVTITFKNKDSNDAIEKPAKCVFWEYGSSLGSGKNTSQQGWSDDGCYISSSSDDGTICKCSHLTDFAVITKDIAIIVKPTLMVYVGALILLVVLLIVICRDIVVWRRTRRERLLVLINECLAMILTLVVFLLGIFLDYKSGMCTAFGALLHWFVLAAFCWLLAEIIQLYLAVRFGPSRSTVRLKAFLLLGWVLPIVFVAIMLAVTELEIYGSKNWCWYHNSVVLLLAYIGPIALCMLMGIIVILKVACIKADMTDETDKKDVGIILSLAGLLFLIVAATVVTGAMSADRPEQEVFQVVFAVFCIFLAIYIFIFHLFLDREITKTSVRTNDRIRPKRDYYSTKETVMYSEGTPEGKKISLIFPSRKSPPHTKKAKAKVEKRGAKRNESMTPFDYDASVPMYPAVNDSSLKSFRSDREVSTHQHTLENPPNTLSAITISRPNSQAIELTSLSDLDRRPDGAEQAECGEPGEFYRDSRHSNPLDKVRQRTSGSSDSPHATTFGKESRKSATSEKQVEEDPKNRTSVTSSAGISRSSVSGASLGAVEESDMHDDEEDSMERQPFIRRGTNCGPQVTSNPPAKIPKRRTKKGSRRRLDDDLKDEDLGHSKTDQKLLPEPVTDATEVQQLHTSF